MIAGGVVSSAMLAWVIVATHGSPLALVPFLALTTAVLLHMPFSVGFHLFRGINADVYNLWRRLDQVRSARADAGTAAAVRTHQLIAGTHIHCCARRKHMQVCAGVLAYHQCILDCTARRS
jgi:predicted membrane channel-forming protein YqfA (hemolysin III family)